MSDDGYGAFFCGFQLFVAKYTIFAIGHLMFASRFYTVLSKQHNVCATHQYDVNVRLKSKQMRNAIHGQPFENPFFPFNTKLVEMWSQWIDLFNSQFILFFLSFRFSTKHLNISTKMSANTGIYRVQSKQGKPRTTHMASTTHTHRARWPRFDLKPKQMFCEYN